MASLIPYIDRKQMIEVDRLMIHEYGISLLQMMEHAGENLARLIRWRLRNHANPLVIILAGNGNNGGGGLVCGRFLVNWGHRVQIVTVGSSDRRKPAPDKHLQTLKLLGTEIIPASSSALASLIKSADLVVDAMIGYGLKGTLTPALTSIISKLNKSSQLPVIALDAPSGLDVSGVEQETAVQAEATLTLALPKIGLKQEENRGYIGELFLTDIGVPPQLYAHLGLDVGPIFADNSILRMTKRGEFVAVSF